MNNPSSPPPSSPRLSVLLPVYQSATTLVEAMDSVLQQTFTNFELLIAYDDSTDGSAEILAEYQRQDARVRIVPNTGRRCMPAALNTALREARGTYVARMDADDVALPSRFQAQVEFLDANTDVALCGMNMRAIDENGRILRDYIMPTTHDRIKILAHYSTPIFHPTWMFRRSIVELLGGYRDMLAEDYDFLLRAIDAGLVLANLGQFGISYRQRPSHRALLKGFKGNCLAYAMHRRRRRGIPDGFDAAAVAAALASSPFPRIERAGQRMIEMGFALLERKNVLGAPLLLAGCALVPPALSMCIRKATATIRLGITR